ncbi:MAG TPA: hypothetical protein VGX48_07225 [Pyrinomonadaceae bacterium]|nr:hypothetical protein [Pyrinomonadaceae bacterium]
MSKRIILRGLVLPLAASAAALLLPPAGEAQRAKRAVAPAVNPKTAAVREATAEVLRETSELRKLAVLRPVRSGAQSREQIEQMLVRNLDRETTPEELGLSERELKKLGMVPAEFELRSFLIRLLTEQVAGYYDPKTREFHLADWIDLDGQKPVMAHELTHALQDQHFNLRRFQDWPDHESDSELAAHALIEGDAMLAMTHYVLKDPMRQLAMLKSLVTGGSGSTEVYSSAPRVLRETLVFPYTQGSAWAGQVFKRGGWELLSASYKELPASTEQILHPEKYFAREAPVKVSVKDISAALGKGWKLGDHDVNGEWGFFLILDEFLKSKPDSDKAVAGWGGDRHAVFTGPAAGDFLIAQKTAWDTEQDAREFFDAYALRTTRRYGTQPSETSDPARLTWKTKEGGVLIELSGKNVTILEGVPEGADARELAGML